MERRVRREKDWMPGVVIGGLLAAAGFLVTAAAAYQLQVTGDSRAAAAVAVSDMRSTSQETAAAREELAGIRLERDRAIAKEWRERVDREMGAEKVRCYSGTRLVLINGEWINHGTC